jgi:hypothetical protein
MSYKVGDVVLVRIIHWGECKLISIANNTVVGKVNDLTKVKIISVDEIEEENIWNANRELVVFRVIETGYFGRYELIPGGYSEYTYDPSYEIKVYDTNDFDYFVRYGLDSEERSFPEISNLIALHEVDKMLLGEIKDEEI